MNLQIPELILRARYVCDVSLNSASAYIDNLVQGCINSITNALELLQSCTKPSIWSNYMANHQQLWKLELGTKLPLHCSITGNVPLEIVLIPSFDRIKVMVLKIL